MRSSEPAAHELFSMTTRSKDILAVLVIVLMNVLVLVWSESITIKGVVLMVSASCFVLWRRVLERQDRP